MKYLPIVLLFFSVLRAAAAEVLEGFAAEVLASNLNAATALAAAPDGRIFIADQTGPLRVWKDGRMLPSPALDLSGRVDDFWERGLIGVALHPDFPQTPHIFLLYVAKEPYSHHVVSRFTLLGDVADPASEFVLLKGDDQKLFGGSVPHGHQGGPVCFGPDGRIYIGIGEQTAGKPSQSLEALQGKILRINADGSIPEDNPFYSETHGKYRAIWAIGIRNPFGLAFEPGTGRLFASDVGQTSWEEINIIERGANYGWPHAEGPSTNTEYQNPIHAYPPAVGRSIVGAGFAPAEGAWGEWAGKFFFADWAANWVKALHPENPGEAPTFARGLNAPATLAFDRDGALLVLNRGTIWRDGKQWQADSGSLVRIRPSANSELPAEIRPRFPDALSAAGIHARLSPLELKRGFSEIEIVSPPWQPGVSVRRWLRLPKRGLGTNAEGEFLFPPGTVAVQHYTGAKTEKPFETHVLWFDGAAPSRVARAAAYRWNADGTEATIVEDGEIVSLRDDEPARWFSPGYEQNLNLDTTVLGFVLPISPRQLTAEDADRLGVKASNRLAAIDDLSVPLERRVRSYLDANCASCHRPGGPSRGFFDARFITPLERQQIVNGDLAAGNLGIDGARLVVPGSVEKSILYQRLARHDEFRMPPTALNEIATPALKPLRAWIESLGRSSRAIGAGEGE